MKRLDKILKPSTDNGLGEFVRRARDMDALARTLAAGLTSDARHAIVAANLRDDGTLVVLASSPAWASRLRFDADALLDVARDAGVDARVVKIRVARNA